MKSLLHIFLFLVFVYTPSRINAQVTQLSDNTNLETVIPLGNIAVLVSENDSLWRTDGTVAGTFKYATNVSVGTSNAYTIFLNKIYFSGTDANGEELWQTDGTAAGTQLVKDINPAAGSSPRAFMVFNNALYFFADDGTNGTELWKTDGTGVGTTLVKNINPLGSSITISTNYFVHNNLLFFTATNGTEGTELWRTDGTETGTVSVKDINTGPASSNPTGFFPYGTIRLFIATDVLNGTELWKTDGTETGTVLVKDIATGPFGSSPTGFFEFNNLVYFDALDFTNGFEGWVTDGTEANTVLLKDINPLFESGFPFFINSLVMNNKMYFQATTNTEGAELWSSDGTGPNTVLFKEINPGPDGSDPFFLLNFFTGDPNTFHSNLFNGIMFMQAKDAAAGTELWKTDGTDAGTVMVKDINPGPDSSLGESFTYFYTPDNLYFSATDGTTGYELWKSDGTTANTNRVIDINPGNAGSEPNFAGVFNGIYLFTANDGDNANGDRDLFRLDGSFAALPLTLLNFKSRIEGKTVHLDWSTVSEINTQHFTIERSSDGERFESIGKVNASGNSSGQKSYSFPDHDAVSMNSNKIFYRLKMVDRDGKFTYSKVVAVNKMSKAGVMTYPNPVSNELNVVINSKSNQQVTLKIFDESGKQVHNKQLKMVQGNNSHTINVAAFAKGSYYINLVTDDETTTTKFVKN